MSAPVLLVLRALGLGDFLTGVPALRALRRGYPDHELVLAAPRILAPLAAACGAVDRLHPTGAYVLGPVDRLDPLDRPPDLAVNLHGAGPQSHRALATLSPKELLAYRCPAADHPYGPRWDTAEHEVARWCRLLDWAGIAADRGDLTMPAPPPGPHAGAVVLHPGASTPHRRWPAERYAQLARWLTDRGERVVVTGSPAERGAAVQVARAGGLGPDAVLAGRTGLAELAALVANARLVVCGDTGVAHLATAYGTGSVLIFGPMSPARWGPPPDRAGHTVLWRGPHGLCEIGVAEVRAAVSARLDQGTGDAAPTG